MKCIFTRCDSFVGSRPTDRNTAASHSSRVNAAPGTLFAGLPSSFPAGRYHSLFALPATLPSCLEVTARTDDGLIMAIEHRSLPVYAVQFHPEADRPGVMNWVARPEQAAAFKATYGEVTYQAMLGVSRTLSKCAFKLVLSGGSTMYGYGYMAVSEVPKLNVNQANSVEAAISLLGRAISY